MTARHRARRILVGLLVGLPVALAAVVLLAGGDPAPAHAAEPPITEPATDATPTTATPTTEIDVATTVAAEPAAPSAGGDGGVGDLEGGATTPSPRGQPAPPRAQRIADSAIAAGLLVVLVGGVAVAIWTARRGSVPGPADRADDGGLDGSGEAVGGPRRER